MAKKVTKTDEAAAVVEEAPVAVEEYVSAVGHPRPPTPAPDVQSGTRAVSERVTPTQNELTPTLPTVDTEFVFADAASIPEWAAPYLNASWDVEANAAAVSVPMVDFDPATGKEARQQAYWTTNALAGDTIKYNVALGKFEVIRAAPVLGGFKTNEPGIAHAKEGSRYGDDR